MRVLMSTQPGLGHLHPMVPLAAACARAGHEVAFACAESFRREVEAFGFASFAAGPDWLEAEAARHHRDLTRAWLRPEHHLRIVREVFAGSAALAMARDLGRLVDEFQPDLLVRNDFEFAAAAVGELTGVPCATVGIELLMPQTVLQSLVGAPLAHLRACLGLPARPAVAMLLRGLHLPLLPPSYQAIDPRLCPPLRFLRSEPVPAGDAELPAELRGRRRRPRVYVTAGTVFNRTPGFFEAILSGLSAEDLDVVATVGPGWSEEERSKLTILAANALVVPYLPLERLLPQCDLVITHGGVNTLLAAFRHGLPTVVVPLSAHHPIHALRVEALGLGVALRGAFGDDELSPRRFRDAVRSLLGDPAYAERTRGLAAEIRAQPSPAEAVIALEELASAERGRAGR
jgi:UDP:flavonoid glycosyltransferase YjiC (YdhE family)